MTATIFLDRDGVINHCAKPHEYILNWDQFQFKDYVIEALNLIDLNKYKVFIITNQRGIARKLLTLDNLNQIHSNLLSYVNKDKKIITEVLTCPHEEGQCNCRKPRTGLLEQVDKIYAVDKSKSWLIGDSKSDILAAKNFGIKSILIGEGDFNQDYSVNNLYEAINLIRKVGALNE